MRKTLILLATLAPATAFAVGGDSDTPPSPTETTVTCPEGYVYDANLSACVVPEQSSEADPAKIEDIRELAYAGRYDDAAALLATLEAPDTPLALTYAGFVARKTGDIDRGLALYAAALQADPGSHITRSYLGQAHVEQGNLVLAAVELREIEARGGAGTWAHQSLRDAILTGRTVNY